ncbi:MAG: universal stress protein [Proteobacteria bacterium]|nr:universal stress protein [Pseudomonadota bacterium]MBS0572501.1 universal stress protein [Pseudomonadota bacterium]
MFRHIIVPTDGSQVGERAVEQGLELARANGAKLTILTVLQPLIIYSVAHELVVDLGERQHEETERHKRDDRRLEEMVRASGVDCTHIEAEDMHLSEAVHQTALAQGCDLIVMPAHERYGLLGKAVDSETVKLLSKSHLPVLVLR